MSPARQMRPLYHGRGLIAVRFLRDVAVDLVCAAASWSLDLVLFVVGLVGVMALASHLSYVWGWNQ